MSLQSRRSALLEANKVFETKDSHTSVAGFHILTALFVFMLFLVYFDQR